MQMYSYTSIYIYIIYVYIRMSRMSDIQSHFQNPSTIGSVVLGPSWPTWKVQDSCVDVALATGLYVQG